MHARRALAVAVVALVATAGPAVAHTDLTSSRPADGATLLAPPQRVTLTFTEDLLEAGAKLAAEDVAGGRVDLGPATVDGSTLTAAWPAAAAEGEYRLSYRAVAGDGHPITGAVTFTVEAADATPSPVVEQPAAAAAEQPQESGGSSRIWAPLGLFAALAVAGAFVWRSRAH